MTWQNLLPSSLGNPSSNKKFLSTKEVESKSPNPTSSAPCPKSEQPPTDIKKGSNHTTGFYSPSKGGPVSIITPPIFTPFTNRGV